MFSFQCTCWFFGLSFAFSTFLWTAKWPFHCLTFFVCTQLLQIKIHILFWILARNTIVYITFHCLSLFYMLVSYNSQAFFTGQNYTEIFFRDLRNIQSSIFTILSSPNIMLAVDIGKSSLDTKRNWLHFLFYLVTSTFCTWSHS